MGVPWPSGVTSTIALRGAPFFCVLKLKSSVLSVDFGVCRHLKRAAPRLLRHNQRCSPLPAGCENRGRERRCCRGGSFGSVGSGSRDGLQCEIRRAPCACYASTLAAACAQRCVSLC